MGVHSGRYAVVNGQSTVRNWSITDAIENKEYRASNTLWGTGRVQGPESWSGSFSFYGFQPLLSLWPGAQFTFLGYTAPDNDVSGVGVRYTGLALVESLAITWNWQTGEPISAVVNFKGHLSLTYEATGAEIFDLTDPAIYTPIGTHIEYSDPGFDLGWLNWCDLTTATLTLTNSLQEYVNSCTVFEDADGIDRLWKGQKPGSLDWTLAVTEQNNKRDLFRKGQNYALRLFVDADDYIELLWGMVGEVSGIQVDRESQAIIQQTQNFAMNGFVDGDVGRVMFPGDVVVWGLGTGSGSGS